MTSVTPLWRPNTMRCNYISNPKYPHLRMVLVLKKLRLGHRQLYSPHSPLQESQGGKAPGSWLGLTKSILTNQQSQESFGRYWTFITQLRRRTRSTVKKIPVIWNFYAAASCARKKSQEGIVPNCVPGFEVADIQPRLTTIWPLRQTHGLYFFTTL